MSKKEFIDTLETTLVNANLDVIALALLDDNTIQVIFKGGGSRKVNIEADSYGAVILDVMKHCF